MGANFEKFLICTLIINKSLNIYGNGVNSAAINRVICVIALLFGHVQIIKTK